MTNTNWNINTSNICSWNVCELKLMENIYFTYIRSLVIISKLFIL